MITKVTKWGNSQGLRLSKALLADVHIQEGDTVEVSVQDAGLMIVPIRRVRGKYSLRGLVDRIPKDDRPETVDWGSPVGGEAW